MILNDAFFQIGQTEQKEFYSVGGSRYDILDDSTNITYAFIRVRMDTREDTYERTVFSVFDFTGLIGGVFEIFEVTGNIIVGYFATKLFMFSMLSNLYQVQKFDAEQEFSEIPNLPKNIVKVKNNEQLKQLREESKMPLDNTKLSKRNEKGRKSLSVGKF